MTNKVWKYLVLNIFMAVILSSCDTFFGVIRPTSTATFTPTSTATATPQATITPTSTFTPLPTVTPSPTATSTPTLFVLEGTPLPTPQDAISVESASRVSALAEWHESTVSDMAWTPDEHLLVVSNPDQINFYDVYSRQILRSLYPITKDVVQIAFNPTGNWLVSGSRRGSDEEGYASGLELWYGPDWKPLGGLYGATRALSDLTFSPDGDFMAVAYASSIEEQNGVDFWNTLTWTISSTLQTGIVLNVAFSPDGSYFASSPDRYAIHIWDLKEDQFLRNLHTSFTGAVNDMTFSPDGSLLATGHYDGTIRLWDVQTGSEVLLIRSDAVIQSLAFSPDGRLLASGSSYENSLVNLWSAGSGELLRALEGHENGVSHLLFAPSSQYLVSASYDGTILLWGIRP